MSFHRPPAHIIDRAVFDVLDGLRNISEPLDPEAFAIALARNMTAQLTNFASLDVLLAMLGAVGGPKTIEAILERAETAKQRSESPFAH